MQNFYVVYAAGDRVIACGTQRECAQQLFPEQKNAARKFRRMMHNVRIGQDTRHEIYIQRADGSTVLLTACKNYTRDDAALCTMEDKEK